MGEVHLGHELGADVDGCWVGGGEHVEFGHEEKGDDGGSHVERVGGM